MNKKRFIPIGLVSIIVILFIFTCSGGSDQIQIIYTSVPNDSIENDSIELNIYVENSGSMDAYMCDGSNLKEAVYDYVSDLARLTTSCNLHYINSRVITYTGGLNSFIRNLTPASFARAGGDRSNTDLMAIIDTVMNRQKPNTVSVFVSDCILDIPQDARNFFGLCQVSVKNSFIDALNSNPNLGVEIIKLESKVDGYWYCGNNREHLSGVKRPYYIWVIGDQRYLAEFNKQVPVRNIIGGIKEYCAYAVSRPIPFSIERTRLTIRYARNDEQNVGTINVEILANLRGSLQDDDLFRNTAQYACSHPEQVTVLHVNDIVVPTSQYSHLIGLEIKDPKNIQSETITFAYPSIPTWVANSNDETGANVSDNLDKTTGLMSLIKGVSEAYRDNCTNGTISFELKNN